MENVFTTFFDLSKKGQENSVNYANCVNCVKPLNYQTLPSKNETEEREGYYESTVRPVGKSRITSTRPGLNQYKTPITKMLQRVAMIFAVLVMSIANIGTAWGADKYYILGAQAVASDGALTKASSHSNLTLKYIKYDGSTYSTTTDISLSATDGINGKYESSAASANISSILNSDKWGTGSGSAYAAGIKFAKNTTYTLSLGSKTITKISFLIYPEGKASSITIGGTAKTTSSKEWTLHEWAGSFTGNVSMSLSDDNGVYGVFILETAAASEWQVKGLDDGAWTGFNMTGTGTVTCSRSLSANTQYEFKLYNTSTSKWWGDGTMYKYSQAQTIAQKDAGTNCYLRTSKAGTYTFSFNTSTKALTVTYPDDYKGYWTKNGVSWSKVYAYCYNDGTWKNADWPGVEITSQTEDICGTHYYINTSGYTTVIFNNGSSGPGNQTGDITISGGDGKHAVGASATAFEAFPTYTISFAANGGSSSMSNISSIACGSDQKITANGYGAPSGYLFAGWKADVAVTIDDETVSAGTIIADQATLQNISSDITLTAQWELIPTYDVTYHANLDGASGSVSGLSDQDDGHIFNVADNGFSKSGYKFKWWNTAANGSGVDYYQGEPDTIKSADIDLYAQWESVASNEEYWVGDPFSWSSSKISVGNMIITAESTSEVDLNGTLTAGTNSTIVNKQSGLTRHAKVMALKNSDKYLQIHFSDGKPINKLYLGSTTNSTDNKKVVVVYSATSDFTTAGGAAHEFVTVGGTSNTVTLSGYNQATKAVTDVSPSLENTYYYARIYRKITSANTVFDNTANLGDGATMRIYSIKAKKGATCTAPSTVTVAPTNANGYRYTPGETISLTCTASGGSGGDYSYQWQKYNGSAWEDIDGATSAVYSKANCTTSDGGSYRCKVSTGEDCTTISDGGDGYKIRVWTFNGNYNDEGFIANNITWTGANTGTVTLTLNANSTYKFKVFDNDGKHFGCNSGITADVSNWTFRTNENNCSLTTGKVAGEYTFTIDITNVNDNNISVSVVYPKMRIYMVCGGTWCDADPAFFVHSWKGGTSHNVKMTAHTCESGLYYADIPSYDTDMTILRLKTGTESVVWEGNANFLNRSSNIIIGSNDKFTFSSWNTGVTPSQGTFTAGTYSPTTYTISFAGNGGIGSMSAIGSIACGADQTITANSFEKTGYNFSCWHADVDVTVGGATVTSGSAIANSATIQNITGNITLTAQWTEDVAPCPTGGDIFTLEMTYSGGSAVKVAANSTLAMTATHGTATGGTVTFGNQNGSSNDKMQIKKPGIAYINGDDAYIRIDFSCPIKTGDVLTFTSDENKEISFTTTDTRSTSVKTSSKKWTVTKAFNDATTLYIWRGSSSSVNLHTINIVRPVTVTFDKNGGSSVSPSSATYDGTSSCVLAETSRTDYHLDGWNTRADGSGDDLGLPGEVYHLDDVTTSTTTVYAIWSAKSCASGTLYKFQVNTGLTNGGLPHQQEVYVKTSDFLSIMTGGYLKAYNSSSSSDYIAITDHSRICIGNSSSYLLVQLDCPLRAGDKIKSTVTTQTLYVTKADVSRTNTVTLPIAANNEQTIPEALVGATELKIWSGSSNGGKISYFEIIRSASTYNVTYDGNDQTSAAGTVPTDATNYAYNASVTTAAQGSLAKTNYTFGGWNTANNGTGTNTAAGNTFTITDNTTLYAKWTQAVTLDANMANHGSEGGSATAVWNATALTGITHATPASGYKLLGYYTTASGDGVKVLNSDGTFAGSNVTDYITSGKWSRTGAAPTLYARYESSGALIWNLGVNTEATSLTTSSKTSAFTQIAVANMTNAVVTGLTYTGDAKSNLTGKISTPASYDAGKYVSVTFQVASGYKFTPSSIKVKVQPISAAQYVKLELTDNAATPNSISYTTDSKQSKGSTSTVEMTNGSSTYFTGTVTLKIFCYGTEYATDGYRLGTPISIDGEVEELCAIMPSFTKMNYTTTTFTPNEDATGSPISIEGGENIDTYQWKYNTTNDRTSGTNCGTNSPSLVPLTDVASGTTRYYWCEMKNTECGITIKSPAVAITVSSSKSDATISWTGTSASANYGGGGYTVKATVNETGWNGNAADLTLSAPAGIRIYNIVSGTEESKKYVQASFDVTTAFDRETYSTTIPFVVTADATATYNAISDEEDVTFDACTGGGGSSEEYMPVDETHINDATWKGGWVYDGIGMMRYSHGGSSLDNNKVKSLEHNMGAGSVITQYYKSSANHFGFYTEKAINGVRLYVYTSNDKSTVSGVYIGNSAYASGTPSTGAVTYEATYYNDDDGLLGTTNDGCTWVEILFDSEVAAGKYGQINLSANVNIAGMAFISSSGSGAKLTTTLTFATAGPIAKQQSSANFTNAATIGGYPETLGTLTYTSSNTSCATVDPSTGEVTITASGASDLSTTITATLAASGCYKGAQASYVINVAGVTCEVDHGTLSSDVTSKCETEDATLTLTGFESGATIQWYKGEDAINNGGDYTITTEGTTSTLVTAVAGTYSVMVTKDECSDRSNSITISNKSTSVHVTRLVKEWYIKNGRLTPDIALWELGDDCSFVSVAASGSWDTNTGLTAASSFYAKDGIVYLKGTEPNPNAGAVQDYTLTLTVSDGCGNQTLDAEGKEITIHHQQNTDKHVLAFVVNGTEKGDWTAGVTADQTTNVGLYNEIATNFDVFATNIYSTDDGQKIKEYYSQFDIICITDYPNSNTKGVNKRKYVDAMGELIDIRPILTMEAFVSDKPTWAAKGISGNPKDPTTRQYTMDLQCKDHEIFAGTDLTKVGEGDEAMYRVSMVDNTKADYAALDATYGSGTHEKSTGYKYHDCPALQGFTFTQAMSDNDLLPIGLIEDGAGNPLQVGIERQAVMEARLMVLGINSYAMERLTDDGKRVVLNTLNYLMKKNAEDIADCSTAFIGGAEDDPKDWDNADNWTGNTVPLPSQKVRILADCEVSSTVYAQSVLIVTEGKYNHGSDNAAGKLTIKENGALIVGGKIQAASAPAYNKSRATTPENLVINTNGSGQAALIFNNDDADTKATVNYYSLGRKEGDAYQFQYFAVPMEYVDVNPAFAGSGIYTYAWHENGGWERRGYYTELYAFEGLGITTKFAGSHTYTMEGTLASTAEREITLTNDGEPEAAGKGDNIIGNSWMAPINIASLKTGLEGNANVDKTVYIYCTGNDKADGDDAVDKNTTEEAGQWLAIPIDASGWSGWSGLKFIPAMQAFLIHANAETTLTLNYKDHVRSTALDKLNEPLRAPRRKAASENGFSGIRMSVADSQTHTDLYLFEGEQFSADYDNGWEAKYMEGDGRSAQFYAMNGADKMAVLATDELEGTPVCFVPGKESNYTISFFGGEGNYYLNDLKEEKSTLMEQGNTYSFSYEEGDMPHRFLISTTPFGIPSVTTGCGAVEAQEKAQKIIYNDHVYIIRGGKIYDVMGKMMK